MNGSHSIPRFDGRDSRQHHNEPLWRLWGQARLNRILARQRLGAIATFVQFAGFPRSGHSLIGSILDAHPQARVSHELDAMGLLQKGFSRDAVFALIDRKAREFTRHGRYWNGFCYQVPGGAHAGTRNLRVIGDKKGDAAVRWIARDPSLLDSLQSGGGPAKKWILVLRHPYDNIATMSLRKGRAYDVLRTTTPATDFDRALKQQQEEGLIAAEVLDSQIDDYASLCETVAAMKRSTPADDWLEICYEDFAASPETSVESMLSFLELPVPEGYVANCASLVNRKVNQSRNLLHWPAQSRVRVDALLDEFSFLDRYRGDRDR